MRQALRNSTKSWGKTITAKDKWGQARLRIKKIRSWTLRKEGQC